MNQNLSIVYQDDDILVINKPSGLPIQPDERGTQSLLEILSAEKEVFLVHRLDQRVSGLVVFAKNKEVLATLNAQFQSREVLKKYRAIVANKPPDAQGKLSHWLLKDVRKNLSKCYENEVKHSQKAELIYNLRHSSERYHLLEIELLTGRFHQIRSQLAAINCPIVGDLKYGFKRSSPDGSIFLQSYQLSFKHPKSQELVNCEIEMPEIWRKYGF